MKKVIFLGMIITLIIISCAKQDSKFPQGAWQLTQVQRVANEKSRITFPTETNKGTSIKIWSERHFLMLGVRDRDTVIINPFAGGTYTLEGSQYEEDVLYNITKVYEGKKVKMVLELKNDTLFQTYHPIGADGQVRDTVNYIEKYIRLK